MVDPVYYSCMIGFDRTQEKYEQEKQERMLAKANFLVSNIESDGRHVVKVVIPGW